jgi:hypothetical protein
MQHNDDWKGEHLIRSVPRVHIEAVVQNIAGKRTVEDQGEAIIPAIRALAQKGMHTSRIAEMLGISIPRVSYYARRDSIPVPDGRNLRKKHR